MQQLINSLFMEAFAKSRGWREQEDQARLSWRSDGGGRPSGVSTDSWRDRSALFPGGNIGKPAICGTANDVAERRDPRHLLRLYP